MSYLKIRRLVFYHLDVEAYEGVGMSLINKFLVGSILFAVLVTILSTEPILFNRYVTLFTLLDFSFGIIFSVEYLARIWTAPENRQFDGKFGRVRHAFRFMSLIDLAAVLPFWLSFGMGNTFLLRLIRLLRILSLAKLGRYSSALTNIVSGIKARRYELVLSLFAALLLMLFAATALYIFEGKSNPESFGSIPRALWWGVATLTKVGYGAAYPATVVGKLFAALFAIAGIGVIAVPTGILAAAFSEAFQRKRSVQDED